jgi:hypothetical protein
MALFDDDFDWEDMAMAGSLAEEMAASDCEQRRLERDLEDDLGEDLDDDLVLRPARRRRSGGEKSPYFRYLRDLIQKKKLEKQLAQRSKGVRAAEWATSTEIGLIGVRVQNAQLVSDKLFYFLYQAIFCHPQAQLRAIRFTQDGTPVVDGHEEFGTFEPDTRALTINLRKHFENAAWVVEVAPTGFSMRAIIWDSVARTIFHELKHAMDTVGVISQARPSREVQESIADQWASEALTFFATKGQAEPPPLVDEPYFGPLITRYLDHAIKDGAHWAAEQKAMLDRGLIYRNAAEGVEIKKVKDQYRLSLAGQGGDEHGMRLNECLMREHEMMREAYDREERCERFLQDVLGKVGNVRVVHRSAGEEKKTASITPRMLLKRGPFIWVKAVDIETRQELEIRIDRILEIRHLF